ncbi:hypothetical protein GIB67_029874 [Kingdonia uniflora]|uniref:Uncharacterized protein n=1 Tax=Kingdonia uniflora TaxID=39325 RepID=A0A7J7NJ94_9MAGN|nr:hypothetical protein GIB67_029874 [Kingdonia uniflora]
MDAKLSRPTSNTKKCEIEQDLGLANANKHEPSHKRKKNMNEGIETDKEAQIYKFNDDSAPQKNDLGGGSAEEALGAQRNDGDAMNEDNVEAPPMFEEPQTDLAQKEIAAPIVDTYPLDRSLLLSFKFHRARSIYLGQSWIFVYFPKIHGIPKEQQSDAPEYCTRWKWGLSITERTGACELLKYREAFDNYKVEDVVWDPYRAQRRSDHDFNENTFFNGLTYSPDLVEPIYSNRVVRQFSRIQPISENSKCVEVSGLKTWDGAEPKQYKPKLPACDPIERVRSKSNNCDVSMEVTGEVPNVCEREQYLMWRDEYKALVEQISALKEEVQKMKDQKKQKQENEKERYEMITEKLTEKATECKQLRARIEQIKQDRKLNDVVHEQYVKSIEKLLAKLEEKTNLCEVLNDCNESLSQELAKKTKECQVLKVENTKLVEDIRIKIGVDAFNASLAIELAKQRKECKLLQDINAKLEEQSERQYPEPVPLVVIPKGEAVPSRNLQKKIDELTVKYEEAVKSMFSSPVNITLRNTLIDGYAIGWVAKCKADTTIHDKKIQTLAWRQAMKKEFYSGELTENDDPTFMELFDQYDRFYTIAQQGPKDVRGVQGEDDNSAFRVPATIKHQSQNQFKKVMNSLESLLTEDPAFWKTVFSQSLDTRFSSRGEMVYEQLRRACSYGGQHVEYRHMGHLLATCYEKVVVFINNREA